MMFRAWERALMLLLLVQLLVAGPAFAQEHGGTAAGSPAGAQPAAHESASEQHAEGGILPTFARLLNFAILAWVLVHFLRAPVAGYLKARSTEIRQDLLTAAELRRTATAQLEEIDRKLKSLPAELEALRARGAEDVRAEQARIAQAAEAERDRLIAQTRREIAMRLRIARRELTEYAAQLAVEVAQARISDMITPADQLRLVDRYSSQLKEAQ
jgi:F-type H+-transporting ATPase subunit b